MREKPEKNRRQFLGMLAFAAATPLIAGCNSSIVKGGKVESMRKRENAGQWITASPWSNVGIGTNSPCMRVDIP